MVKFVIKGKDFQKFLQTIVCKGTVQFNSKSKVDKDLFSAFFINADEELQCLNVLTIDTHFVAIKQDTTINAKVLEAGIIEISNSNRFEHVFKGVNLNKNITVTSDEDAIHIVSEDGDKYRLRIIGDAKLDQVYKKKDSLFEWQESHTLEEITVDDEVRNIWKITLPSGSALYPMKIQTTKEALIKFVGDSVNLTKDNSTIIKSENGKIFILSGAPNGTNSSEHPITYIDAGKEIFNFAGKWAGLQAIVKNLLDDIFLSFRKMSNKMLILRIDSFDENIHQIIAVGSEDKDGILWSEEDESKETN